MTMYTWFSAPKKIINQGFWLKKVYIFACRQTCTFWFPNFNIHMYLKVVVSKWEHTCRFRFQNVNPPVRSSLKMWTYLYVLVSECEPTCRLRFQNVNVPVDSGFRGPCRAGPCWGRPPCVSTPGSWPATSPAHPHSSYTWEPDNKLCTKGYIVHLN